MPNLDTKHLSVLTLNLSDLEGLTPDEQQKLIRKHWLKLSLELHPDKNPNNESTRERFIEVTDAYEALKERNETYQHDINAYFNQDPPHIPDTAFDLLLQESIEEAFNAVLTDYRALQTETEKQVFANHYASFITLAQTLEKKKDLFNANRADYLFAQENGPVIEALTIEWRRLLIRLFAEEYLDDFQYRHALGTGELNTILATRKLLSPLKLLAAIIGGVKLAICHPTVHYFKLFMQELTTEFSVAYNAEAFDLLDIGRVVIKIAIISALLVAPYCYAPTITLSLFSLPAVASFTELLACPVNQFIRPIAAYTRLPVLALTTLFSIAGAGITYGLAMFGGITSLITLLPYLSATLGLYCFTQLFKLLAKIYELNPTFFFFQITMITFQVALSYMFSDPIDLNETFNVVSVFLSQCNDASMLYYVNKFFENISAGQAEIIEVLPLPEEAIDESLKEATLLAHKKAVQSNRFFNTPKQAEFIKAEDRTFWQQASSFFGDGMRNQENVGPNNDSVSSEVLTIAYTV